MKVVYDAAKNEKNIALRGISFDLAEQIDLGTAMVVADTRRNYGEARFLAFAPIEGRLYALVFTKRAGAVRVISLRRANRREIKRYG